MLCVRIVSLDLFTIQDGSPGIQSPITAEESGQDHNIITLTNGRGRDPKITDSMFALFGMGQTTYDPKHKKQKVNYSPSVSIWAEAFGAHRSFSNDRGARGWLR